MIKKLISLLSIGVLALAMNSCILFLIDFDMSETTLRALDVTVTNVVIRDTNNNDIDLNVTTSNGVVVIQAEFINTSATKADIYVNGYLFPAEVSGGYMSPVKVVLKYGINTIAVVENDAYGDAVGRSEIIELDSSILQSLFQFQLKWDGADDLDLHVDDGYGNNHCYWDNLIVKANGYDMYLDVDNRNGYGPENIRVADAGGDLRCFVNYWSVSSSPKTATVYVWQNGVIKALRTHKFSVDETDADKVYNSSKSWVVGTY